jgi:hypothetical protein
VQEVLYTRGLDYRHGSVAGWLKPIAPDGETGPGLGYGGKFRGEFYDCQRVATVEGRR